MGTNRQARSSRRGAVVPLVAVCMVMMLGFVVLAVDTGQLYLTRTQLQATADAAVMAATAELRTAENVAEAEALALEIARRFGETNKASGVVKFSASDIEIGDYYFNPSTGKYIFDANAATFPSAVRVTARQPETSLFWAGFFGRPKASVAATAMAVLQPRDIMVVVDLSGSMKHDSYLRFYDKVQLNARDIWAALDGPEPSRPYIPGPEDQTEYADDTGPTVGAMSTWGNPINPDTYDPTTDPALWYIPKNANSTSAGATASLTARGFDAVERSALLSGAKDGSYGNQWRNRTAVILGLATWTRPYTNATGQASWDKVVRDAQITWIAYPSYRKTWTWADYLGWASETSGNKLFAVHPQFRYRMGLKTYVDFLLDRVDNFSQTNLTKTPEEPLTAVKDGIQAMVDATGVIDQIGLVVFGSTGRHELNLSLDRQRVADTLYARQANHYDNSTNTGEGLQLAVAELNSSRARDDARKVIVLMSDGMATMGPDPVSVARDAAAQGIRIYTVSVGVLADTDTMTQIARVGNGETFYATGDPTEYSAQLRDIFRMIGGKREVFLAE